MALTVAEEIELLHLLEWEASLRAPELPPLDPRWSRAQYPLRQFVEDAWPVIEPATPFIGGWHVDAICDHLMAVTRREIRHLLINVPFRSSKSRIVSVLWPAWAWIEEPALKWLYCAYAGDRALRDASDCRNLVCSPWYHARWGTRVQLDGEDKSKGYYVTTARGHRVSVALGGQGTGEGGDFVIADDPHNTDEDDSETRAEIQAKKEAWVGKMSNRYTDPKTTCWVVVGQRVAVDDLSADLLQSGVYAHLKIPMEYEPAEAGPPTPLGWQDPRTQPGELMCPARFGPTEVAQTKAKMPLRKWESQANQRPQARSGQLFPRSWWQYYPVLPDLDLFDVLLQSWDMRFGDEKDAGSFVAGQVWGKLGARVYLLDRLHERLDFNASVKAVETMSQKWPRTHTKLIEKKANGPAVIRTLASKIPGLVAVEPDGSKYARAESVTPFCEAGNVFLPAPHLAPWVEEYQAHMEIFPAEPNDDGDATSQALIRLLVYPRPEDGYLQKQQEQAAWQRTLQRLAQQTLAKHSPRQRVGTGV